MDFLYVAFFLEKARPILEELISRSHVGISPCKHTFMRSVLAALIVLQIQKKEAPQQHESEQSTVTGALAPSANNRRSVTTPPANQRGVVQQADQWLKSFSLGGGD